MDILIYMVIPFVVLIIIFPIIILRTVRRNVNSTSAERFDVFQICGSSFTVLSGIPVTYNIDEIEKITFYAVNMRGGIRYTGAMRVVKSNGKKSRQFYFDSSAYKKQVVRVNSKQDIEQTIQYLMNELSYYNIHCSYD